MKTSPYQDVPVKTWWVPLWRGLVVDPQAKHRRAMGPAVWLFLHLALHAKRSTGQVRRRLDTLTKELGANPRTVRAWMRRLAQGGYIRQETKGAAHVIHIAKWRMPSQQEPAGAGADSCRPRGKILPGWSRQEAR